MNIQNAPAAPDFNGTAGILGLMGKSDLFRDMAGLDQTQKNALAGLQEAYKSANASQKAAIDMVVQGGLPQMAQNAYIEKHGDRMLESLQKGVDDKLIDPETAKNIASNYYSRSLGGNPEVDGVQNTAKPDIKAYDAAAKSIAKVGKKLGWSQQQIADAQEDLKGHYNMGGAGNSDTNTPAQQQQQQLVTHLNALKDIFATMKDSPANMSALLSAFTGKDENLSALLNELLQDYAGHGLMAGDATDADAPLMG